MSDDASSDGRLRLEIPASRGRVRCGSGPWAAFVDRLAGVRAGRSLTGVSAMRRPGGTSTCRRRFADPGSARGMAASGFGHGRRHTGRGLRGERGSGTVLALGIIGVLLAIAVAVSGLIQAQAAAGRARAAADLSALAGATALNSVLAPADPCPTAGRVAQANGAALESCVVDGEDVVVTVSVHTTVLGVPRQAQAAARAGPVNPL